MKDSAVQRTAFLFVVLLIVSLTGCGMGLLYTHTISPLDLNSNQTPLVIESEEGDVKHLSYSLVDVQWDSNAIGDIARENGIETVYFADIEFFSILGIWTQDTVHIYGR